MIIALRTLFFAGLFFVGSGSILECGDQSKMVQEKEKENKRSKAMLIANASNSLVHQQLQQQPVLSQALQASPGTSPDVSENSSTEPSPTGSPLTSPGSSPASPRYQATKVAVTNLYHEWPYTGGTKMLHRIGSSSPVNQAIVARPIARQNSARDLFPGK